MSGRAFHSIMPEPAPTASPAGVGNRRGAGGGGEEKETTKNEVAREK